MEDTGAHFVKLATVGDVASARLAAALLSSAGIESRVHGESLGPYPMTIGEMALTEIWVLEDDLPEAREVMLEAEVDSVLAETSTEPRADFAVRALALGMAVILAAAVVRFLMRVF
jgi:hypothetical protein